MEQPKIEIHFGTQREGYTFRLRPKSLSWLEERYPHRRQVDSVFIGYDKHQDLQQLPESIWENIVQLLTGFSSEELNEIGGFRVVHPVTQQEIYNSFLIHA